MRLKILLVAALLAAAHARARAQEPSANEGAGFALPVSVDRIRTALDRPSLLSLRALDERPTFRIQILERQRVEELLATLNFKTTRASAGGIYWDEIQRVTWRSSDNPLVQPYAPFSGGQMVTLALEGLVGKLVGGKVLDAIGGAMKSRAENSAREEVLQAIQDYCTAQPGGGTAIAICATTSAIR